jgi:alpha-L-fucosidase
MIEQEVHPYTPERYIYPTEKAVLDRLDWFRDQKFALMMHWGIYNQLGIVESWGLVDEDSSWSRSDIDWIEDPRGDGSDKFKRQYWGMNKSFNPVRFRPDKWAELAVDAGFRYCIVTAKHHDGFCMYDSLYSDYKVTADDCPYHRNENADIIRVLFDEFRKRSLGIGAYFSKADWHHPDYWDSLGIGYKTTRNPTYDTFANSERFERFARYTKNQVVELVRDYGRIDIIWLDAGWVCPNCKQDIHIEDIMTEARKYNPSLISADRTCGGICENYITPEQTIPDNPITVPWESCITMGEGFSYRYDDKYKDEKCIIHMLLDVAAKGGNLALNVSPEPDGRIPTPAERILRNVGAWLRLHDEGIYGTRAIAPYKRDDFVFTGKPKENILYAYKLYKDESKCPINTVIPISSYNVSEVIHMRTGRRLGFSADDNSITVTLPEDIGRDKYAEGFMIRI